jgi:hypothetical protein
MVDGVLAGYAAAFDARGIRAGAPISQVALKVP